MTYRNLQRLCWAVLLALILIAFLFALRPA
jgi:hypothetical protein